jgi:hypothetical protein
MLRLKLGDEVVPLPAVRMKKGKENILLESVALKKIICIDKNNIQIG